MSEQISTAEAVKILTGIDVESADESYAASAVCEAGLVEVFGTPIASYSSIFSRMAARMLGESDDGYMHDQINIASNLIAEMDSHLHALGMLIKDDNTEGVMIVVANMFRLHAKHQILHDANTSEEPEIYDHLDKIETLDKGIDIIVSMYNNGKLKEGSALDCSVMEYVEKAFCDNLSCGFCYGD